MGGWVCGDTPGGYSYHVSAVWKRGEADAGAQITLLLFISHSVRDPKLAKTNKIKLSRMVHSQANHKNN